MVDEAHRIDLKEEQKKEHETWKIKAIMLWKARNKSEERRVWRKEPAAVVSIMMQKLPLPNNTRWMGGPRWKIAAICPERKKFALFTDEEAFPGF